MKDNTILIQDIDRYLNGEMIPQEMADLELRRQQDPAFDQLFLDQKYFRKVFTEYGDRIQFQNKLDQIQTNYLGELKGTLENVPSRIFFLQRKFWSTAAIAASVSILIAIGTLGIMGHFTHKNNIVQYIEMKRVLDDIKRSQTALINDIHKNSRSPINPGTFGGTGFALSSDGYLATNYHVIENADSIYVQNNKGEAFKVKVVYQDPELDLAILKVEDDSFRNLPPLPYTFNKKGAQLGEEVYTLGFPKDEVVYGKGYISSETGFLGDSSAYQIA
ncbi:MAG: trypsin-like peptidase domain-containing protein, partial [Chitinophagaceae bacterium]